MALLYGGAIFACRHCHQLAYASTREDAGDRATRRADQIRERLGWEPGFLNGKGSKPKWKRLRTFYRLKQEHDALIGRSVAAIAHKFRDYRREDLWAGAAGSLQAGRAAQRDHFAFGAYKGAFQVAFTTDMTDQHPPLRRIYACG